MGSSATDTIGSIRPYSKGSWVSGLGTHRASGVGLRLGASGLCVHLSKKQPHKVGGLQVSLRACREAGDMLQKAEGNTEGQHRDSAPSP